MSELLLNTINDLDARIISLLEDKTLLIEAMEEAQQEILVATEPDLNRVQLILMNAINKIKEKIE